MKKIIITILIILLLVLAYFAVFNGISMGNFKILSVKEIVQENEKLDEKIKVVDLMLKSEFPNKQDVLSEEISDLLNKKEEYYNIAKVSTEGEINKANTEEVYLIEYLWTRIGRHATSEGVNLKMDVNTGDMGNSEIKNLFFTMQGSYVGIIDFIYSIEDDSELNFKIENFKMVPSTENANLTATFNVKNIRIKQENTTGTSIDATQPQEETNTVEQNQAENGTNTTTEANAVEQTNAAN